jgi:hypothetical protein
MGALQILFRSNPMALPGLTLPQRLLFFEACFFQWLALPTVVLALLPVQYVFTAAAPVRCAALWEFTIAFLVFFGCNRAMVGGVAAGRQRHAVACNLLHALQNHTMMRTRNVVPATHAGLL